MAGNDGFSPPYGPPANLLSIIHKWRDHSLPEQVTREWQTKIGLSPNLATLNERGLQFLGLIDEQGFPTERATALKTAPSDQYHVVLDTVIRAAYKPIFEVLDPSNATRTQVDDAFRHVKPEAQRSRMVACFLGLCREAGISLKEPPQGGRLPSDVRLIRVRPRSSAPIRIRTKPTETEPEPRRVSLSELGLQSAATSAGSVLEKLLQKFPDFDPAWSDELKASWFAGFSKLQDELKK